MTKKANKTRGRASLLTSMLFIVMSALVVSISLTIILFSLTGKRVYGRVLANGMRSQARSIAETSAELFRGNISQDGFHMMMSSSDTTVIILDSEKQPFAFSSPRRDDLKPDQGIPEGTPPPDRPDGMNPRGDKPDSGDKYQFYVEYCTGAFDRVVSSENSEYMDYPGNLGVVVGLPVMDEDGTNLGAVFLIKPINDITENSKSIMIVLVLSAVIVALLLTIPVYFVSKWIASPLKNLTAAASEYSAGQLSGRVVPDGTRELTELGETFNELADNLERNISELTIERNRLRAVLEGLSEGLIAFDSDYNVINHNASALTLLGANSETDIRSLPCFDRVIKATETCAQTGESCVDVMACGERAIRISAAPVDKEGGQVVGFVALLMDMTEAERLEQTRRDYVANVSHELRTPLASIRGIADMLNDGLVGNEEDKQRYYGYILKESIRLSKLINDLLELSRLQSGGVALKLQRFELFELIADIADMARERAEANGMSLELTIPEAKYYAFGNPDRVEQVLVSLTDNALKHGEKGGRITLGMDETEDKWLVWVENPAEIEGKDLDHLFERFYKADTAHTGEGTGLGLAITEEALRIMGESISVSYEEGVIRFTFTVSKEAAKEG